MFRLFFSEIARLEHLYFPPRSNESAGGNKNDAIPAWISWTRTVIQVAKYLPSATVEGVLEEPYTALLFWQKYMMEESKIYKVKRT